MLSSSPAPVSPVSPPSMENTPLRPNLAESEDTEALARLQALNKGVSNGPSKQMILSGLVVVLLIIIGGGLWYVFGPKGTTPPRQSAQTDTIPAAQEEVTMEEVFSDAVPVIDSSASQIVNGSQSLNEKYARLNQQFGQKSTVWEFRVSEVELGEVHVAAYSDKPGSGIWAEIDQVFAPGVELVFYGQQFAAGESDDVFSDAIAVGTFTEVNGKSYVVVDTTQNLTAFPFVSTRDAGGKYQLEGAIEAK